jgi:hypothetical protein
VCWEGRASGLYLSRDISRISEKNMWEGIGVAWWIHGVWQR